MKLNEATYKEQKEFSVLLSCWLAKYTDEVKNKVVAKAAEIYEDKTMMALLRNYKAAKDDEDRKLASDIYFKMTNENWPALYTFSDAQHYSSVLYDLLIK